MKQEALSLFNHPELILTAFLLFFSTFLGILIWALKKSRQDHYDKMASLPLELSAKDG
ncbi:MAG: cbb3-type cytochrome c oxidase subunit 3 [Bdellovibrionota bacterium]